MRRACRSCLGMRGLARVATDPSKLPACREHLDLVFARRGGRDLKLDLLVPASPVQPPPVLLVLHGGGWREGSRKDEGAEWLLGHGFALARIDYRYSREAPFPAQLEDAREALDWVRSRAPRLGCTAARVGALGTSAGGLLALLLGADPDSHLAAVVAYCAPTDLVARARVQPQVCECAGGSVHDLLGGPVSARPDRARAASPAHRVRSDSAPVLLLNGTADATVRPEQPLAFVAAALAAQHRTELVLVPGAPHCGDDYQTPAIRARVAAFLAENVGHPDGRAGS